MDIKTNDSNTIFLQKSGVLKKVENPPINRASLFGDGVFETMVFSKGKIRFAKEHEERLNLGLGILHIDPSSVTVQYLEEFVKKNFDGQKSLRIRWNVYRGGLGKYTPLENQAEDMIIIEVPGLPVQVKSKAYISKSITIPPSPWSHCKTLNGLPYVMANIERVERKMDEVILLSDKGFVSEAGIANIFWKKGDIYYTPSLSCNCIAGVARRKIIEVLQSEGIAVVEGEFTAKEIMDADQIFTSNVTGITYIAQLENRLFKTIALPLLGGLFE